MAHVYVFNLHFCYHEWGWVFSVRLGASGIPFFVNCLDPERLIAKSERGEGVVCADLGMSPRFLVFRAGPFPLTTPVPTPVTIVGKSICKWNSSGLLKNPHAIVCNQSVISSTYTLKKSVTFPNTQPSFLRWASVILMDLFQLWLELAGFYSSRGVLIWNEGWDNLSMTSFVHLKCVRYKLDLIFF